MTAVVYQMTQNSK